MRAHAADVEEITAVRHQWVLIAIAQSGTVMSDGDYQQVSRNCRIARANSTGRSSMTWWWAPAISAHRARGLAAENSASAACDTTWLSVPRTARIGQRTLRSAGVRSWAGAPDRARRSNFRV